MNPVKELGEKLSQDPATQAELEKKILEAINGVAKSTGVTITKEDLDAVANDKAQKLGCGSVIWSVVCWSS